MIDQKSAGKKNGSIDSDFGVYDIDINFELNNGEGAWVVILQKNDNHKQGDSSAHQEVDNW